MDDFIKDKYSQKSPQQKFWTIFLSLLFIPAMNSTFYNASTLCKEVVCNVKLQKQKKSLEKEKTVLQTKLKEYHSKSGLKRAIKQEISLIEENEILIKIV